MGRHQDRSARRAERLKGGSTVKGFFNKHLGALLALLIVLTIPVGMVWAKYAQNLTVTSKLSLTVTAAVTKKYTIDKQKMWKALRTLRDDKPTTLKFVKGNEVPGDAVRKYANKGIQADGSGEIGVYFDNNTKIIYIAPVDRNSAVMYAQENCSEFLSPSQTYLYGTVTTVDLGNLDTSNVTDMSSMFYNCYSMTNLDFGNLDTSKVTDMNNMFYRCYGMTTIDLSSFNTACVTNMSSMFNGCSGMTTIDLSKFNTACVTDMSKMFNGCSKLNTLDVTNFDTSEVINMQSMFESCGNITTLDLSNFNTACVTNMSSMFGYCRKLTSLDLSSFNTACVTKMSSMFEYCENLTSLDVSSFNTEKVTTMSYMFSYCGSIQEIDLHSFSNKELTDCSYMFEYCRKVDRIHICGFDSKSRMNITRMFSYLDALYGPTHYTYIYAKSGMSIAGSSSDYSAFHCSAVIGPKGKSNELDSYNNTAKQAPDGYFTACNEHTGSNAKSVTFDFSGLNNITAVPRGAE